MKFILVALLMTSFLSISAFAAETSTECPMMKENDRTNPKANLGSIKTKVSRPKTSGSQQ